VLARKDVFQVKMRCRTKVDYPSPYPSTRIPKHLHGAIPEHPMAFLQPSADVPSARHPPPMDALLKTKAQPQFDRTVDSLSKLLFNLISRPF
jgi:hypothetical protein